MPTQFLSPNVFNEEVASVVQTTQGVSPSNAAFIGFTTQGPVNTPTLVTSFNEYNSLFGTFHKDSFMTHNVAAYFSNDGRNAYINRVIPSDAISATASIQSKTTNQLISTGNGSATVYTDALPALSGGTVFSGNTAGPIVPGSVSMKYRAAKPALVSVPVRKRDGVTALTMATGVLTYEGKLDTSAIFVSSAGVGKIAYRSLTPNNTAITVAQLGGISQSLLITAVGNAITVQLATDGGGLVTTTPTLFMVAFNALVGTGAAALVAAEIYAAPATIMAANALTALADGLPVFDADLNAIVPGTSFTIGWSATGVAKSITLTGTTVPTIDTPIVTETNGAGSSLTLDLRSGIFSLDIIAATEDPDATDNGLPITVSYIPASTTIAITSGTAVDTNSKIDLLGTSTHLVANGGIAAGSFVNVATGSWSLTFTAGATHIPSLGAQILATFKRAAWELTPISAGEWGNDLKIQIQGSTEFFTAATSSYSKYNVFVLLKDENDIYQLKETFEDLDFTDSTSNMYFPDVVSELSELINVTTPGADEAPGELTGILHSQVLAGGDESSSTRVIQATLAAPIIAARTVTISYTNTSGTARTITDDGSGNLTGNVDTAYSANTINYTTGALDFKLLDAVNGNSLVTISYRTKPEETAHVELFGDTAKDYTYTVTAPTADTFSFFTLGTNGTFSSANYGRDQFSNPTLEDTFEGIYALNKVEEILQVCVPDFAGDVAVTIDLLNYADSRAAGPQGGDRFIVLTVPVDSTSQEAVDWFRFELVQSSNYAALYWPWMKVKDPLANNRPLAVPPLGHVAGVYARTDSNKNVGKGPGGTVDGKLNYLIGLETIPTLADRDLVYPNRINPLISSAVTGTAVWGVRTISADSRWKLINARRLFMFVEHAVYALTQWAVFENNGPALWAKLKGQLTSYLGGLFNDGYFAGVRPSDAFIVTVDSTNNDQASIDAGKVNITVMLKPFKSVEFIVIQYSILQNA